MSKQEKDWKPSWLDADNDASLKAEIAPLFGSGGPTLMDPEEPQEADMEADSIMEKGSSTAKQTYGAVNNEEDLKEPSVVSSASGSSSKQHPVSKIVITETGKPEMPRRNFALAAFHFIEGFGVVTSLSLMATQLMPIILIPLKEIGFMSLVLKIYYCLFCLLFILVEWDVPIGFLKSATFLQTYVSRGFLYSFLGLSCLEEAYSERVKEMVAHQRDQFHVPWLSLFLQVSSWMMLGLGVTYMLLGICCLKRLRDKLVRDHRQTWTTYREAMKRYRG